MTNEGKCNICSKELEASNTDYFCDECSEKYSYYDDINDPSVQKIHRKKKKRPGAVKSNNLKDI